jgi:hypothetical protein
MEEFEYDTTPHSLSDFEFEQHAFYLLLSSRKSGKSFMIQDLAYTLLKRKLVNYIYLFSATAKKASAGYDWIDKRCVMDVEMIDEGVKYILNLQEKNEGKNNVLVIFDDIDLNHRYADSIDKLATRGRHYGITTVLSAQITNMAVTSAIKANAQYIFFRTLTAVAIKKEVYSILSNTMFEYPRDLYKFVRKNNRAYQFVVYLNDNREPEDAIKVAKAEQKKFRYECNTPQIPQKKKEDENGRRALSGMPSRYI